MIKLIRSLLFFKLDSHLATEPIKLEFYLKIANNFKCLYFFIFSILVYIIQFVIHYSGAFQGIVDAKYQIMITKEQFPFEYQVKNDIAKYLILHGPSYLAIFFVVSIIWFIAQYYINVSELPAVKYSSQYTFFFYYVHIFILLFLIILSLICFTIYYCDHPISDRYMLNLELCAPSLRRDTNI
jgi:hypothetical protein